MVVGLEDMRLFSWGVGLWFSACARDLNPDGWCEQVLGRIDFSDGVQAQNLRSMLPETRQHEKNWAPRVCGNKLDFMYRLGHFVDYDARTTFRTETGLATENISGGSQAIPYAVGWLTVVHEARYKPDGQRYYQHRFVWMDSDGAVKRISRPFFLHDKQIEFVAGLARHPDGRVIISYGVRDCEAWTATVQPDEVDGMLWYD
jgi:hypothetical protein